MRMVSHAAIQGDNDAVPVDAENNGDSSTGSGGATGVRSAPSTTMATFIAVIVLAAVIVSVCCVGGFFCMRSRRQKRAQAQNPAAAAIGLSPRGGGHKRTISQAVMARVRANDEERTPLHTPAARDQQFFHDE